MDPLFFKYIVPSACTERLRIPRDHHWNKDRVFPYEVILRDERGNKWAVKLEKVDNRVCFVDGWLEFVKDNSVQAGNFIAFQNVGTNLYSFTLFDQNKMIREEEEKEDDFGSDVEQTAGGFEAEEDEDEDENEEDDDYDPEEESIQRRGNTRRRTKHHMAKNRRTKSPQAERTSHKTRGEICAAEIFESGVIPRPKNPYFVTRRRADRNDGLYIPAYVIKDYNLNLPMKAIIRDTGGTEWATELSAWRDGRRWYNGGWGNFCLKNHVFEGEDCVCEFVEEAGKGLILFVYKLNNACWQAS